MTRKNAWVDVVVLDSAEGEARGVSGVGVPIVREHGELGSVHVAEMEWERFRKRRIGRKNFRYAAPIIVNPSIVSERLTTIRQC